MICRARMVTVRSIAFAKDPNKRFTVRRCRGCGYIGNPENFNDYRGYSSVDQFPVTPRVGTEQRPGREFHMARMGAEILGGDRLSVLIYGPGRSLDYRHVGALPSVGRVAVADLMRLHDDVAYVNIQQRRPERFSLVLACEVVEHFTDPRTQLAQLLSFVSSDGLVICSTNVFDGGDPAKHNYLFIKGHTSYYSPESLTLLAHRMGFYVDFRVPESATTYAGPRKRYVLFTKSDKRLADVARYFGRHTYAPSER